MINTVQEKLFEIFKELFSDSQVVSHLEQQFRNGELQPEAVRDIICGAPVSLDDKRLYLFCAELAYPNACIFEYCKDELECALYHLHCSGEASKFTVEGMWFDPDIYEEKGSLLGVCDDYESVINCIKEDFEEYCELNQNHSEEPLDSEEDDWAGTTWYEVKKWDRLDNGRYVNTYIYYFDGTEVNWFIQKASWENKYRKSIFQNDWFASERFYNSSSLFLRTGYSKGDILSVDCRPFRPRMTVEVMESYPNSSNDELWVHFEHSENKEGECYLQNLGTICYPINHLSPFYRIKRLDS